MRVRDASKMFKLGEIATLPLKGIDRLGFASRPNFSLSRLLTIWYGHDSHRRRPVNMNRHTNTNANTYTNTKCKKSGLIANVETIWHSHVSARFGPVKKYIKIQTQVKYKYRNTKIQVQELEMIANEVLKPSGMAILAPDKNLKHE